MASELAAREAESQKEKRFLRGKIEAQDARIRVLLSNTARGRAMLYWTSMKSARAVRETSTLATCHLREEAADDADLPEWLRLTMTGTDTY